jgi:uncharacterized protein
VLNVVDFGAFVDVGLSDSGLIHISQLSAGYVRDPHDVVAVGDQVRAWVSAIDKERRRVALTMIAPGTERPKPDKSRRRGRRQDGPQQPQQAQPEGAPAEPARKVPDRTPRPPRRAAKQRGDRRDRRPPRQQPRTGSYEKRAPKELVPITKEMAEGKAYLRSFGDLLQFTKKKDEPAATDEQSASAPPENGSNN